MTKYRNIIFKDLVTGEIGEICIDITMGQSCTDKEEVHYSQELELEDIEVIEAYTTYENDYTTEEVNLEF